MSGRPEILFPLFGELTALEGIGPRTAQHLAQIEIDKPRDLLFLLPYSGIDRRRRESVLGADLTDTLTV